MIKFARIADYLNILSHVSFSKGWNMMRLGGSFYYSKLKKQSNHAGNPYALSIEPTTACNLGCPECPSGLKQFTREKGKLDVKAHEYLLDQTASSVFYINYYFQGEPFLHPNFLDLIRAAKKRSIYTATSTNAHFITPERAQQIVASGLDRLIISIDGLTQETYESYRVFGSLAKVLEGTQNLLEAKKMTKSRTPYLIFQFLATSANEHEIEQLDNLVKEYPVDEVRIKTAQFYEYENGNALMPSNEKYARYKKMPNGKYKLKYKTDDSCWRMWSSAVLTWDGKVVPCCFDKDAKYQIGDAYKEEFSTIWNSPAYNAFRNAVLTNRQAIDICSNCSEGAKVWA